MLSTNAAATLRKEAASLRGMHLRDLLADAGRARGLVYEMDDLRVDLSHQKVTAQTMTALLDLATETGLVASIDALFAGERINKSEDRAVVHMAQRAVTRREGTEYAHLSGFADSVRCGDVTDLVNIGIGGSDLGPAMVSAALASHASGPRLHYVSNVDPSHLHDVLTACDPARTLIIVTSKTFTTAETIRNAALARDWQGGSGGGMVAVTAAPQVARGWGIDPDHIFDFDQGVGGRYSLWSAVGLPVMIDVGPAAFIDMLAGAAAMDDHFRTAPHDANLPVLMGLLRVWNRNFMNLATHGIMPYDQRLHLLPAWAQQLEMESNGKSVLGRRGATAPCDDAGDPGVRPAPAVSTVSFRRCIRAAIRYRWIFWCRCNRPDCTLRAIGWLAIRCWSPVLWRRPRRWPSAARMRPNRTVISPGTGHRQSSAGTPQRLSRSVGCWRFMNMSRWSAALSGASTVSTNGGSSLARRWPERQRRFWLVRRPPTGSA